MESLQPLDAGINEDNHISVSARHYLKIAGAWAKFIAIVQMLFFALVTASFLWALIAVGGSGTFLETIINIVFLAACWTLAVSLFRFGSNVDKANRSGLPEDFDNSFRNLKTFFMISGIFTILFIIAMILAIFFGYDTYYRMNSVGY